MKKVTLLSTAAAICGLVSFQSAYADDVNPSLTLTDNVSFTTAPAITTPFPAPSTYSQYKNYIGAAVIEFATTSNSSTAKLSIGSANGFKLKSADTSTELAYNASLTSGSIDHQPVNAGSSLFTIADHESRDFTLDLSYAASPDLTTIKKVEYSDTLTLTLSVE